jgi:hypothetical protein
MVISLVDFSLLIEVLICCSDSQVCFDNSFLHVISCHFFMVSHLHFPALWFAVNNKCINSVLVGTSVYRSRCVIFLYIGTYQDIVMQEKK